MEMEIQGQGQGSGERRAQGEGVEGGGIRNTETEETMGKWKETKGMAGWGGLQAWEPAWS